MARSFRFKLTYPTVKPDDCAKFFSPCPVKLAFRNVEPDDCAKDKAPIIFIHGLSLSKESWEDVPEIIANATKRKAYVIDSRNHGDSEWSDEFTFDLNIVDLLNFMDAEGVEKAILIGHKMGGLTAVKTALKAPEKIEKIVLEDVSVRAHETEFLDVMSLSLTVFQQGIELVPAGADEATVKEIINMHVARTFPPYLRKHATGKNDALRVPMKVGADGKYEFKVNIPAIVKSLKNPENLEAEITGIYKKPALFIRNLLAPSTKDVEEPLTLKFFPKAEFVGIEDATHTVHNDCPQEFTEAVLKFIRE